VHDWSIAESNHLWYNGDVKENETGKFVIEMKNGEK